MGAYDYPAFSPEGIVMGGKYPAGSPEAAVMNATRPAPPKAPPVDMTASNAALAARAAAYKTVAAGSPEPSFLDKFSELAARGVAKGATANYGNEGRGTSALAAYNQTNPTSAYAPDNGVYGPPEPEMTPQAQQLASMGVKDANRVVLQDKPADNKAAGEAAINAGGGPRMLNYGDNTIVGESVNGSKKLNSFTGFGGTGAAAAGAGKPADPFADAQAHLVDIMKQASALRARGDITGALQARGLESHAMRMAQLFTALGMHSYQQGQIGVQNREVALREQVANPSIKIGNLQAAEIGAGNLSTARKIKAAEGGQAINPAQAIAPMGYVRDPDTGEMVWKGFPTGPTAR